MEARSPSAWPAGCAEVYNSTASTDTDDASKSHQWSWDPHSSSGAAVPAFHCALPAAPATLHRLAYRPAGAAPAPHLTRGLQPIPHGGSGELILSVAAADQHSLEASTSAVLLPAMGSGEQPAVSASAPAALPSYPPPPTGASAHHAALAGPAQVPAAAPPQAPLPLPPHAARGAAPAAAAAGMQGGAAADAGQPSLADDIAWLRGLFSDSDEEEGLVLPQRQLHAAQPPPPPFAPGPLHPADSLAAQLAAQRAAPAAGGAAPVLREPSSLQAQLESVLAQVWEEQQAQQAALSMAGPLAAPPPPMAPPPLSAAGSEASMLLALCQPAGAAPLGRAPSCQPSGGAPAAAAPAAASAAAVAATAAPAALHTGKPAKRRRGERYSDAELAVLAKEDPPRYRRILSTRKSVAAHRQRLREARAAAVDGGEPAAAGQQADAAGMAERLRLLEEENRRMREQLGKRPRGTAPAADP